MKTLIMLPVLFLVPVLAFSLPGTSAEKEEDTLPDNAVIIETDRNSDGEIDYLLIVDDKNLKITEKLDFNYDGAMDDFYYYSNGVIKRREIDSNYDGNVDIWVYIVEGVYIEKYERDSDFDGIVDIVKNFGE